MKALNQESDGHGLRIAPLIDIVFLLLIFFLVATTVYQEEKDITIKLAGATEGEERVSAARVLMVNVKKSGLIVVNQRVKTLEELEKDLRTLKEENPSLVVIIRSDRHTYHKHFVRVLNLCEKVKVGSVAVAILQNEE